MKVLAIGYGKNLFIAGHPERERQLVCAAVVTEYHMIVFARESEGLRREQTGNFFLYPTGGSTKVGMLVRAFFIGRKIMREARDTTGFVVTAQDPFEAGMVGYLIARLYGTPLNLQEHGDFFSTSHWRAESPLNHLRWLVGKYLLTHADTVRVVSKRMLSTIASIGVPKEKLRLLSVAVPLKKFLAAPASDLARQLFPPESVIILTVARLVPQKNLTLLLNSFAGVAKENATARLLIFGIGPQQETLVVLATTLGLLTPGNPRVVFLPWTDEVPAYMKSSDIYALSSNYEGYARVIPEAMACGMPLVSTDVGCVGEIMTAGEHGLVVPVGDGMAFTTSLTLLVRDVNLRLRYGANGRASMQILATAEMPSYAERWRAALK